MVELVGDEVVAIGLREMQRIAGESVGGDADAGVEAAVSVVVPDVASVAAEMAYTSPPGVICQIVVPPI